MAIANGTCVSFCNQPKAHFGLPWVRQWDNRSKCYMDEKKIQCLSNTSQHVLISLQPFTSYSDILVGNCNFSLPLAFNAPVGSVPIRIPGKSLDLWKLESWGYHAGGEDSLTIGWAVSTQYQRVTDRQSDGQTDVQPVSITCAVYMTHVKNVALLCETL